MIAAGMRQHDPIAGMGHDGSLRGQDLNRRSFGDGPRLIAQPLPKQSPILAVMRWRHPERGAMIERGM